MSGEAARVAVREWAATEYNSEWSEWAAPLFTIAVHSLETLRLSESGVNERPCGIAKALLWLRYLSFAVNVAASPLAPFESPYSRARGVT
jgi:hypothetical protein